jgi:hypothetical protein
MVTFLNLQLLWKLPQSAYHGTTARIFATHFRL